VSFVPGLAAVAGFLAGYCGATRRSYASDLRLFSTWCHQANLSLFTEAHYPVSVLLLLGR
jgi:hypothetical protein